MKVEDAIARAKSFIGHVFAGEDISQSASRKWNDEAEAAWMMNLGLMRPSVNRPGVSAILADAPLKRTYKIVKISDSGEGVPSIKIRQIHGED